MSDVRFDCNPCRFMCRLLVDDEGQPRRRMACDSYLQISGWVSSEILAAVMIGEYGMWRRLLCDVNRQNCVMEPADHCRT